MKIVKFNNGKYGVRTYWFFGWSFIGIDGDYTWRSKEDIIKYCMTNDLEKCKELIKSYTIAYKLYKEQ